MTWITTTDRNGRRCYVLADGTTVSKDGCGSLPWTVYYRDHDDHSPSYGMTDTMREAKAWGEMA